MAEQVYGLFGMVITGAAAGILFDILYALRQNIKIPAVLTDTLFWLITVAGIASAFVCFNDSVIRGYEIIGLVIGAVLYFLTISRHIRKCFIVIFEFFFKKIKFICEILLTPLRFLYKMLYIRCFLKLKDKKEKNNEK